MAPKKDKKKGPKGKKARSKAKKENHWGMKVDEDTPVKRRRGKSRILSQMKDITPQVHKKRNNTHESDDSASSDGIDDLIDGATSAMSYKNLLNRIGDDDDASSSKIENDIKDMSEDSSDESNYSDEEMIKTKDLTNIESEFLNHYTKPTFENKDELNDLITNLHQLNNLKQIDTKSMQMHCSSSLHAALSNHVKQDWMDELLLHTSLSSYADVLCTIETHDNRDKIYNVIVHHLVEHVLTSNKIIIENDKKIQEKKFENEKKPKKLDDDECRDQGYTKPKVLLLVPTRGTCYTFIQKILKCTNGSVRNLDRFHEEYGPEEIEEQEKQRKIKEAKGKDWNYFFGDGVNHDDDFRIGLSITPGKKTTVHLYSDFYRSDVIVSSPLSMKMTTSETYDFLSSIELCILAHSDVLLYQNWDHVIATMDAVTKLPNGTDHTDFSRVRDYFLAGQGCHWRQLILVSQFNDPNIQSTFKRNAKSFAGEVRFHKQTKVGTISNTIPQVFQKITCDSLQSQTENRVAYFMKQILPPILRMQQKHTLIFIPSYFDYVALRNAMLKLQKESYSKLSNFVSITEYARVSEINRGRSRFHKGHKNIMLYTGRAHFFKRYKIKGVKHVVFFGVPEYCDFYSDVLKWVGEFDGDEGGIESPPSCLTLYTRYDAIALERIVGFSHCQRMVGGDKSTYLFTS